MATGPIISYCRGTMVMVLICIVTRFQSTAGSKQYELSVSPLLEPAWFLEGDPFLLTCTVNGSMDGKLEWWKNGQALESGDIVLSSMTTPDVPSIALTLKKEETTIDDGGRYNCWYNSDDVSIEVKVITVTSRDANLTQGYPTTLTCDVEPYTPMCSISWLKGGTPLNKIPELEKRLVYGEHNTTATINNSKMSDVGVYTCVIQFNRDTEFEQRFTRTLGIRGKPRVVTSDEENLKKVTNTSITLFCPVNSYPPPEVFWKRGDEIIEASDRYILTSYEGVPDAQLEIKNPTKSDYGSYACVTENSMGKSEHAIELKEERGSNAGLSTSSTFATLILGLFFTVVYKKLL